MRFPLSYEIDTRTNVTLHSAHVLDISTSTWQDCRANTPVNMLSPDHVEFEGDNPRQKAAKLQAYKENRQHPEKLLGNLFIDGQEFHDTTLHYILWRQKADPALAEAEGPAKKGDSSRVIAHAISANNVSGPDKFSRKMKTLAGIKMFRYIREVVVSEEFQHQGMAAWLVSHALLGSSRLQPASTYADPDSSRSLAHLLELPGIIMTDQNINAQRQLDTEEELPYLNRYAHPRARVLGEHLLGIALAKQAQQQVLPKWSRA